MSKTHGPHKMVTLVITCLGAFMVLLDASIITVALVTIQASLHANLSDLQWAVDAYTLPFAALMLTAGTLGDRFGRKRLFLLGLILFLIGSTFCGYAPSLNWLLISRVIQGLGAAALSSGSLSVLASAFPETHERARAIGIWAGISGLALAAGPLIGGLLIQVSSWPAIFFVNLPVGIVAIVFGLPLLSESCNPAARRIDLPGQILVSGALVCLIVALIEGSSQGWTSPLILSLLIGAAVLFTAFFLVEARTGEPLLPLGFFKNSVFSASMIVGLVIGFVLLGTVFFIAQFFQAVQGFTALESGIRTLPATMGMFIAAPFAGRITARLGPRLPIMVGALLGAIALFLMIQIEPESSYTNLWWPLAMWGIGFGLMLSPLTSAAISAITPTRAGLGSSMINTSRQVGSTLGIAVLGTFVLQQFSPNIVSQLTQRGVPAALSTTIANKIAAAGAQAGQVPLSGTLPLPLSVLHQAISRAFADSLHGSFLISGICLLVVALLGGIFLQPKQSSTTTSTEAVEQRKEIEVGSLSQESQH